MFELIITILVTLIVVMTSIKVLSLLSVLYDDISKDLSPSQLLEATLHKGETRFD